MSEWGRFLVMAEFHKGEEVIINQICERYEYGMARESFERSVQTVLKACKDAAIQNHIYDEVPYIVEQTETMAHIHDLTKEIFVTLVDASQQ